LESRDRYADDDPAALGAPTSTIYVYQCPCGCAFTKTIRHDLGHVLDMAEHEGTRGGLKRRA
jgi:hypothetical protein